MALADMASLSALYRALEALDTSTWVRTSTFAYPVIEIIHLVGIATLFGSLLLVDAAVITGRRQPALVIWARSALHTTVTGFILALVSGALLFAARATEIGANRVFWAKMALLLLAGVNAWWFHRRDGLLRPTAPRRWQAVGSLVIWVAVIACGRMIAYV